MNRTSHLSILVRSALLAALVVPSAATRAQGLAGTATAQPAVSSSLTQGQSGPNLASGAPSSASVNGKPIPLCSHGGVCQGALMRAMGQP